ncbi:MAG TPA: HEPN domain-containing protein [Pseudolysinimonas sp.]|nr:HEPN domain-containing protein [Pseudolysinimonas sp.]
MLRWEQGRAVIDAMIESNRLELVPASRDHANELVGMADTKLVSAAALLDLGDASSAFGLAYDAARLALTAVLAAQGLRPKTSGGHLAVYEAAMAQLDPPMGGKIRPFDRLRRTRNEAQYPSFGGQELDQADVRSDLAIASSIVDVARPLIETMPVY